ncbi:MAG: alpha/beta hydrolase [Bacteriovoracaceae bacterium]|jgi:pimeloyl-ACP methyl ester carboxylesterase|nr:alpha/beta hydrolase [Bacteriovoracaceae bacterium]
MAEKTNWIFIRGLVRSNEHWGQFLEEFKRSFPDSEIILLELEGNGKKNNQKSYLSVEKNYQKLRQEWLLKRKSTNNWNIIAVSLGAMVGMLWDSKHQDFKHSFYINTSSADLAHPLERLSWPVVKQAYAILRQKNSKDYERRVLELTTQMTKIDTKLLTKWDQIHRLAPTTRLNLIRQLFAASRYIAPIKLNSKGNFIASKKDILAKYTCSQKLAKKLNASFFLHPQAGHDLPLDDPQWLIEVIKNNISS